MIVSLGLLALIGAARAADVEQAGQGTWQGLQQIAAVSGLQVNVCNDISGEKFLCEDIFAEFCTYCRRADGNKCVTKKGVKRAEAAGYDCEGQPPPAPKPSPEPAPPPHHHHHHHHHHPPSPEPPAPEPTPAPEPVPHHHHKHHHKKHHDAPSPSDDEHDADLEAAFGIFGDDEDLVATRSVSKKHHEGPGFECHFPNQAYCAIHSNCEWCTTGGVAGDACYTRTQAAQLPKEIWKCSGTPSMSKPLVECHYGSQAKCLVHPDCDWCSTSGKAGEGGVGDGCFTSGQAKLLPEKIWSCTKDSWDANEESDDEASDNAATEVGKPIVECHYDGKARCIVHPDCDWCTTSDKAGEGGVGDGCFTSGQAKLLPEKIWSCTKDDLWTADEDSHDKTSDEAAVQVGKPIIECHYDGKAKCIVHPDCDWCTTSDKAGEGGVGDGCFTSGQAKLLPEKIWSCTKDDLWAADEDSDDEASDEAAVEVGKPIVKCHYDGKAKCIVHPDCDWCTTSDKAGEGGVGDGCFTSGQAKLLPEKIWSCTKDDFWAAAEELSDNAGATVSKPIIECHYDNEAKCVVHPNCEWCSTSDKAGEGGAGDGCFTSGEAKLLPEKIWSCAGAGAVSDTTSDGGSDDDDEADDAAWLSAIEREEENALGGDPLVDCHYDSEAKCIIHKDCVYCKTSDKSSDIGNGCYTSEQADLLPEKIWKCTVPRPGSDDDDDDAELADNAAADVGKPLIECHYDTRAKCVVHPDCEWCKTDDSASAFGSVGNGCYTKKEADLLPEKIWSCSVVADIADEDEAVDESGGDEPIVKCHYDTHDECAEHSDCEWCKTADKAGGIGDGCFASADAEKLPETIWACSKD